MKIYTKTGDLGETGLFGGQRVLKSHLRVEAYGTVDELNSYIGWLRDVVENPAVRDLLAQIQHRLFTVGAHLASDPNKPLPIPDLKSDDIQVLETAMDEMDARLPPLKNFILPGGHPTVSICHVCRTVCRRAERLVVTLHETDTVEAIVLQYLNRLSDYFFVLARQLAQDLEVDEVVWKTRQ